MLGNKSPDEVTLPHPQSRKKNHREKEKPNGGSIVGNFFKRAVNVPDYRNAKDDVDPAKD